MAAVLRGKGIDAEETLFEEWRPPATDGFRLAVRRRRGTGCAAAIVTTGLPPRCSRAERSRSSGTRVATGPVRSAPTTTPYARLAPEMSNKQWQLDWVSDGIDACALLEPPTQRIVTWTQPYTRVEWERLLGTHSDHRILPDEQRTRLHSAVGDVIDRHGGRVEVVYDVEIYLSRRVG